MAGDIRNRRWVIGSVLLGTFSVSLNNSALNLALPALMEAFEVDSAAVSWVITAFLIAMGMTMPITGYLGDRFGKKAVYLTALALFIIASLPAWVLATLELVIICRVLQGVACGLMIPLSLALMFAECGDKQRGKLTGIWGSAMMLAPAVGPAVGGVMLTISSWQSLFIIGLPPAIVALLLGMRFLRPGKPQPGHPFDLTGFGSVTLGVGLLLYGANQAALVSQKTVFLILVGMALMALFIRVELKSPHPLLHLSILGNLTYSLSMWIICVQAIAMFASIFLIPLLIQQAYGYSSVWSGLVFLPTAICSALCVAVAGRWLDRNGPTMVIMTGLMVSAIALLLFGTLTLDSPLWLIFLLMMLRGVGLGFSYMTATTAGLNVISDALISRGLALSNVLKRVLAAFAVVLISVYFDSQFGQLIAHGYSSEQATLSAIKTVFIVLGGVMFLTIPAAFFLQRRQCSPTDSH